ncbi:ribosomal protein S5 domain 2-like protein [Aulographum hederae CBS 113979]|uniref:Ribosomal protein S5 domain 2-like protein n=1 Tax=Aulographum hederae CBS 113979 TaxID=1176131 RepID=A0A6G1HG23_9PEZI|nr:ribosomal protein S5 domain 2-like protein [Aulographum hederae CBS 113979]
MSLKRSRSPAPSENQIYISSQIDDRASTFLAHFSPTLSAKALQAHPSFASASHRIAAWRHPSKQRSLSSHQLFETGFDDDGEKWAGKKLLGVLEGMKVTGAVCVGRWYGGVLLGPVRFRWVEEVGREAVGKFLEGEVREGKRVKVEEGREGEGKRKVDEERVKERLVKELKGRDENITVLRALLGEKSRALKGEDEPEKKGDETPSTPKKEIDYEKMSLPQLRGLDRARDATVTFILKQIDQVERKLKEREAGAAKSPETE